VRPGAGRRLAEQLQLDRLKEIALKLGKPAYLIDGPTTSAPSG